MMVEEKENEYHLLCPLGEFSSAVHGHEMPLKFVYCFMVRLHSSCEMEIKEAGECA